MSKIVTVFGGSGFIGRYVTERLAMDGWRIKVAVRRPNEALFVKKYGAVGQIEVVPCNIRDDASVREAVRFSHAAVNCVGVLSEIGRNTFEAVHVEGATRVARAAADAGARTLVHLSAIGADPDAESAYARSKGQGEKGVLAAFPDAAILRPSVLFGPEDRFFNRFAAMARLSLVLPVVGADTRFQPVYVEDVARAAQMGVDGRASGIYELGGPDIETMRELMARMLRVIERRRLIVNTPFGMASFLAFWFDLWQTLSGGLIKSPLTRDQVKMLRHDNIVAPDARSFADLGIAPEPMDAVLPEYLYRFRPDGQYAGIREALARVKA